jgi:hypothetical protein
MYSLHRCCREKARKMSGSRRQGDLQASGMDGEL